MSIILGGVIVLINYIIVGKINIFPALASHIAVQIVGIGFVIIAVCRRAYKLAYGFALGISRPLVCGAGQLYIPLMKKPAVV